MFLQDIDPDEVVDTTVAFQLPFFARTSSSSTSEGARGVVYAFRKMAYTPKEQEIDARGWTFQELYLSARTLEFRSHQVRLTCLGWQHRRHEGASWGLEMFTDGWVGYSKDARDNILSTWGPGMSHLDLCRNFYRMVGAYTLRRLTDPRDRILAISGMAEVFSRVGLGEYLAGVWRESLPFGLLWRTQRSFQMPPARPTLEQYQAPSWSWAGCKSAVEFVEMENALGDGFVPTISHLESQIDLAEKSASWGAVRFGSSVIGKGKMRQVLWYGTWDCFRRRSREEFYEPLSDKMIFDSSEGWISYAQVCLDALEEEHEVLEVIRQDETGAVQQVLVDGFELDHVPLETGHIRKDGAAVRDGRRLQTVMLLEVGVSQDGDASVGLVLRPVEGKMCDEVGKTTGRRSAHIDLYSRMGLYKVEPPKGGMGGKYWHWTEGKVEEERGKIKEFLTTFREQAFEII